MEEKSILKYNNKNKRKNIKKKKKKGGPNCTTHID